MNVRALSAGALAVSAAAGLCFASIAWLSTARPDQASSVYPVAIAIVAAGAVAMVVWLIEPAYTLSAAIFLTPFAGNWEQLGVPGALSPDRLLFAGAIIAVLMRAPRSPTGRACRSPARIGCSRWPSYIRWRPPFSWAR